MAKYKIRGRIELGPPLIIAAVVPASPPPQAISPAFSCLPVQHTQSTTFNVLCNASRSDTVQFYLQTPSPSVIRCLSLKMKLLPCISLSFLRVLAAAANLCNCGFTTTIDGKSVLFTDAFGTDFRHVTDLKPSKWRPQTYNNTPKASHGQWDVIENVETEKQLTYVMTNKANRPREAGHATDGCYP